MVTPTILAQSAEMPMFTAMVIFIKISILVIVFIHIAVGAVNSSNCTTGSVRLVGGSNEDEGRVEFCVNKAWSSVCTSSGWNRQAARVVCNQLGDNRSMLLFFLLLINLLCS